MFTQSLLRGLALQQAQLPGQGPFDATNIFMGWALAVDLIASTLGAPLARWRLASTSGRNGYALQQLCVLFVACGFIETLVLRSMSHGGKKGAAVQKCGQSHDTSQSRRACDMHLGNAIHDKVSAVNPKMQSQAKKIEYEHVTPVAIGKQLHS